MPGFVDSLQTFGDYAALLDMVGTGVVIQRGSDPEVAGVVSGVEVDSNGEVTLTVFESEQVFALAEVRRFKRPPGGR